MTINTADGTHRPEKGTPEYELWLSAIDVLHAVPLKKGTYVFAASVPWDIIEQLRTAVEGVGIDWRAHHPATTRNTARKAAS